ncbi:hypothetical protein PLICRDRAFT_627134 [Plicaturopsis crispa FD-325 SS-3]|nr:hypothetical protein PLICRDRAFT_627134 [Plicaturopsis crispa FD-325 SS-3]
MATTTAALLKPLQLGSTSLRNRVFMAALTRNRSVPTNVPNALNLEYYTQRARGGAGLIVTEGTTVDQQGLPWEHTPGIWSPEQIEGWKKITESVHAEGSRIFVQLAHGGRLCHPDAPEQKQSGRPVYAPSAIAARGGKFHFIPGQPGYAIPTEVPDPSVLVDTYKRAAVNAKAAGFDGIEVHGASGTLIPQFLDTGSNIRTDSWGGSVANRCRFALEVLKAVVDVFGPDKVAIKLNPAGGANDVGMPLQETIDTFSYLLTEADKLPLAYICLSRYRPASDPPIDGKPRGTPHDILQTYRPFIKRTPLVLNGGLSPPEASTLIAEGKIDAAQFGWLWIGHPDLVKRIERGLPLDAVVVPAQLYGAEEGAKGYTDYPEAVVA